jgi:hypothetical protein
MMSVRHWFAGVFVLGSSALFGLACSSTNKNTEEPLTPASAPAEERRIPNSSEVVGGCPGDRAGEPRQCVTNEECCDGFTCSVDPERSRVAKFCLEG